VKKMAFTAQVYDVRLKRNGGRVQLDFGVDAMEVMAEISKLAAMKDMNFEIVVAVLDPKKYPEG
jgi:hypothetical protein